ncbi:hypothetical protein HF995_12225 [Sanguibacter hominis ATCC BAA-789]|uniref:Uncharacterized protein n=1 Tax=Sanguibacter hominis ATCC BAA-789 TaxID=1312740 RepID=A0A9X5IRW1_9MICO|nr:hypothetical protein [Sanguibacter hominis]NKX94025.1 hypothetical protein [Sanguibacter hominis ATCC BAA-789]
MDLRVMTYNIKSLELDGAAARRVVRAQLRALRRDERASSRAGETPTKRRWDGHDHEPVRT